MTPLIYSQGSLYWELLRLCLQRQIWSAMFGLGKPRVLFHDRTQGHGVNNRLPTPSLSPAPLGGDYDYHLLSP
jgi:hypothetical protein